MRSRKPSRLSARVRVFSSRKGWEKVLLSVFQPRQFQTWFIRPEQKAEKARESIDRELWTWLPERLPG